MRAVHWSEAERVTGERLDRRLRYALHRKHLLVRGSWTWSCSGCCELGEYEENGDR